MTDAVRAQYEAYPYPARDPRDEDKRLLTGSPSHLDEINHYVFGGRLDVRRPLRVLVAGGGTGDGTVMLAQHCADAGIPAEITYLDLSQAARRIAEARVARRGLANVAFHQGSLFDAAALGRFDYIDCCGVLHHLPDPQAGLRALVAALAPGGGIGLMVYGTLGRTGVYPLQAVLRTLTDGIDDPAERVALARRLLTQLPATNWFRHNPFLSDHLASDAGLYDLLLHSQDRAFTVPELAALAAGAGLAITALIEPLRYDPDSYVADPRLRRRWQELDWLQRAALAEQLSGSMTKHVAYLVRAEDAPRAVARPDGPEAVPVLKDLDGPAMARGLAPGAVLKADLGGHPLRLPLPRLAGPMLARIDGRTTLGALHADLADTLGGLDWADFKAQFDALYAVLNGMNKLLLRRSTPTSSTCADHRNWSTGTTTSSR